MADEVHYQRPPAGAQWMADYMYIISGNYSTIGIVLMCSHWAPAVGRLTVKPRCHGNRQAQHNCRGGVDRGFLQGELYIARL